MSICMLIKLQHGNEHGNAQKKDCCIGDASAIRAASRHDRHRARQAPVLGVC